MHISLVDPHTYLLRITNRGLLYTYCLVEFFKNIKIFHYIIMFDNIYNTTEVLDFKIISILKDYDSILNDPIL